jgi:hypothetical protein
MRRILPDSDRNGVRPADRRGAIHRARRVAHGSMGATNRAPMDSVA